jgi:hypothetical protein
MSAVKDMPYIMIPVGSSLEYAEKIIAEETTKWFGDEARHAFEQKARMLSL